MFAHHTINTAHADTFLSEVPQEIPVTIFSNENGIEGGFLQFDSSEGLLVDGIVDNRVYIAEGE